MTEFIAKAIEEKKLGLALHYPLIHAAVLGLNAKHTFEFGAGGSTRVFFEALANNGGGEHRSVSTDSMAQVATSARIADLSRKCPNVMWGHAQETLNAAARVRLAQSFAPPDLRFDIVLHDGAHDKETVAGDIAWIWPRLKCFGLLLVHDTQHSGCGEATMAGLGAGLSDACATFNKVTLPYGFGLTIVRKEAGTPIEIKPAEAKPSSPHRTTPF